MNYTRHFDCGCKVVVIGELTNVEIKYCPKHQAAPELLEALEELAEFDEMGGNGKDHWVLINNAKQVIAEAKFTRR